MGFAKSRQYGKNLLQHCLDEFMAYPLGYHKAAIEEGRIKVNEKNVTTDYVIKPGDHITHFAVWDETPVLNLPIEILFEDDCYIVVNKPPSMPVHPCGNFKFNSLMKILELEHGKNDLKCVHWLDRQTSGIVFFAKNTLAAHEFEVELWKDKIKKIYLTRVRGDMRVLGEEVDCTKTIYTINPFLFTTEKLKAT